MPAPWPTTGQDPWGEDLKANIDGQDETKASEPSGTPDNTKFYRGDGVWAAPPAPPVASVNPHTGAVSLNAADVGAAPVPSGTPDNTKFSRGDGVWSAPSSGN